MKDKHWVWLMLAVLLLALIGHFVYMTSSGYHLEWSRVNGRMIWVDKDGKP